MVLGSVLTAVSRPAGPSRFTARCTGVKDDVVTGTSPAVSPITSPPFDHFDDNFRWLSN